MFFPLKNHQKRKKTFFCKNGKNVVKYAVIKYGFPYKKFNNLFKEYLGEVNIMIKDNPLSTIKKPLTRQMD